jgi:23S rRNA (adenine2503-C2)-methyltransferase
MSEKRFILDMTADHWEEWTHERGFPRFRAEQIFGWLMKGVLNPSEMKNLPQAIVTELECGFDLDAFVLEKETISEIDGTRKYVFRLGDGNRIETVLMKYRFGTSVCISSQAGCKMGCTFCASAHAGFGRDLTAGEMLAQVIISGKIARERISRVVVMGIGEPFDNYDSLIAFIDVINSPRGLHLGARHITVSTCGLVPQMIEFMCVDKQVNLSVSLHAANDALRARLMPINKKFPLDLLIRSCREYTRKTGRRITFEYALLDGVNDSREDAGQLAALLRGMNGHINLIAANEFPGSPYHRSRPEVVQAFRSELERLGMNVTVRREMGTDIMAACGQLRRGLCGNDEAEQTHTDFGENREV